MQVLLEGSTCVGDRRAGSVTWARTGKTLRHGEKARAMTARLEAAILELSSTELTRSSSLLLQHLLLVGVGVAYLDCMLVAAVLGDRSVVELLHDFFADVSTLEAGRLVSRKVNGFSVLAYRAKPTPRPLPLSSRRMREDRTLYGRKH